MSLQGQLLVAEPALRDENFHRTVVFLLEHSDAGALGLVLNRPGEVAVRDAVPSWAPYVTGLDRVFVGGPVTPEGAVCLVRWPHGQPLQTPLVQSVSETVGVLDLHRDPSEVPGGLTGLRIFAGYSGWSAGQLESELEAGGWYVFDAADDDPFTDDVDALWRRVLQRQGGELRARAHFPDDPSVN